MKLYSCDSVSGAAMLRGDGDPRYRAALLRGFLEFVRHELIPMIRMDCDSPDITVITAGASIGAFNAVALLCHYPDVVTNALGMSGTYDISRFVGEGAGDDLYFATPSYFLPGLNGEHLALLRSRQAILASGEGRWENTGESWRLRARAGEQRRSQSRRSVGIRVRPRLVDVARDAAEVSRRAHLTARQVRRSPTASCRKARWCRRPRRSRPRLPRHSACDRGAAML